MWHHEESVTDCKNRCAIDHDAIKQDCSLSNQLSEERAGKNLSGIGRASSTCQDKKLASRRGENVFRQLDALVDQLDFSGGNLTRCRGYVRFTHQAIRHSWRTVFIGIISRIREPENPVHVWPAEVAVDQEHAITLLGQDKRIIGACETFAFVGHSTCEKRNFSLGFRTQERKRGTQIAERFRRRTFRSFHHDAIVRTSESFASSFQSANGPLISGIGNSCKNRQTERAFCLVHSSNGAIQRIDSKNESQTDSEAAKQAQQDRFRGPRTNRKVRKRGMLNNADRIRLDVFCQVRVFYLAKDAFVQRTIGFGLPRQFLIADRRAVEIDRDALLVLQSLLQTGLCRFALLDGITHNRRLRQDRLTELVF